MGFLIWLGFGVVLFLLMPGLGLWYVIISALIWGYTGVTDEKPKENHRRQSDTPDFSVYDKVYENGVRRVKKISGTGYIYSNGVESYVDALGNEHRSNGEIIRENAYIPERWDIYKDNQYIGYEYEDACGVTRRSK